MNQLDRALETARRAKQVSAWGTRFAKLKRRGVSQKEFCGRHGVSEFNVIRYLKGRVTPGAESFDKINAALKKEGV